MARFTVLGESIVSKFDIHAILVVLAPRFPRRRFHLCIWIFLNLFSSLCSSCHPLLAPIVYFCLDLIPSTCLLPSSSSSIPPRPLFNSLLLLLLLVDHVSHSLFLYSQFTLSHLDSAKWENSLMKCFRVNPYQTCPKKKTKKKNSQKSFGLISHPGQHHWFTQLFQYFGSNEQILDMFDTD